MGFSGLNISRARKGSASKPVIGFRGISITMDLNLPILVRDIRGRGVPNASIVVTNPNTGNVSTAITDLNGNATLFKDNSNPNPIKVTKNRVVKTVNYTDETTLTIVLDMMKVFPQAKI